MKKIIALLLIQLAAVQLPAQSSELPSYIVVDFPLFSPSFGLSISLGSNNYFNIGHNTYKTSFLSIHEQQYMLELSGPYIGFGRQDNKFNSELGFTGDIFSEKIIPYAGVFYGKKLLFGTQFFYYFDNDEAYFYYIPQFKFRIHF
jgi:hypothetical protein